MTVQAGSSGAGLGCGVAVIGGTTEGVLPGSGAATLNGVRAAKLPEALLATRS